MTLEIDRITVTEDRAHVVRRGAIELPAGTTRVRIEDVAPVIADKTLRARAEGAKVGEVRVVRRKVTTQPAQAHATLAAELEEKMVQAELGSAEVRRIRWGIALLDEAQRRVLSELAEDAARGTLGDVAAATFEERERAAYAELATAEATQRELEKTVARLRTRLEQTGHEPERVVAAIELVLTCEAAVKTTVEVEYLVPGACWRPQHTAKLGKDGALAITTDGCIWQNTGEDWKSVELLLSTDRPSLGQKPPSLDDDEVVAQKRSEVLYVEQRDVTVETTGLGGGASQRVPGIDDGGEVRVLKAKARATIPSDGRPYRVPALSMETKATTSLVAYPELAQAALVRAEQTNGASHPLLAGPVDLVRESGFVGRTKMPLIAAGERFELGFGPDPQLRVRRKVEEVDEEPGLLPSSYIGRAHRVFVFISNLGDAPRSLTVTERIPVSEMEKVEVTFDEKKTSPSAKPDGDGFVRWKVELAARAHTTLSLRYVVRRHKDVVGLG